MTNPVDSKIAGSEGSALSSQGDKSSVKRHRLGYAVSTLVGVLVFLTGFGIYEEGQKSRDVDVEEAGDIGNRNTAIAIALGNAGFTNVIRIETLEGGGSSEATLSDDPANPQACQRTFRLSGDLAYLFQVDASGREFSKIPVATGGGAEAEQALSKIC